MKLLILIVVGITVFLIMVLPVFFVIECVSALLFSHTRQRLAKQPAHYVLWGVISLSCVWALFDPGTKAVVRKAYESKTKAEMAAIQTALTSYETEYGVPLKAADNAHLIAALTGDNPRKIQFLVLKPRDQNNQGEAVDAWGTPFRLDTTDPDHPKIESAGPDKKWGTADDMPNEDHR